MDQFDGNFASHWDELVGWEARASEELPFLSKILKEHGCFSILDVALGTGFHSIILAKEGYALDACDISPAMVAVANENIKMNKVFVNASVADWSNLSEAYPSKQYDCIICLGNSFACETDIVARNLAVSNWTKLLSKKGIIIVDRRNYEAMLSGRYNNNPKGQYFGKDVRVVQELVNKKETLFRYIFPDKSEFTLAMSPILDSEMVELAEKNKLRINQVYGDRMIDNVGDQSAFYTYVLTKE
jgi:SAM-dependent methyltransferase